MTEGLSLEGPLPVREPDPMALAGIREDRRDDARDLGNLPASVLQRIRERATLAGLGVALGGGGGPRWRGFKIALRLECEQRRSN